MPITPDTKDWTWVLERACPDCGFESSAVERGDLGRLILQNAASWEQRLLEASTPAERPSDDRWSLLEYACHVRDVFRLYDERLRLMLDEDNPTYPNWDQDATAIEDRYGEQDPRQVAVDLVSAAGQLAADFDAVTTEQWARTGLRSDGATFTIDSFGRYLLHDPVHHLHDVTSEGGVTKQGG